MKKIIMFAMLFIANGSIFGMQNNQSFDQWQAQRRAEEQRRADEQARLARLHNQPVSSNIIHNASPSVASQANRDNSFLKRK